MIVFSAFTPHSPLLLASVNKAKLKKVQKTVKAMALLADALMEARPDTIIIFSSHGTVHEDAFSINVHDDYPVDLAEFGDLTTNHTFRGDMKLIDALQRSLRAKDLSVTLSSEEKLDYGAAVPLLLLTEHLPNVKIVPITYSGLSAKHHFQFGEALKDVLLNSNKRVAVIASGDQSHALETRSPAGFAKEGAEYDQLVQSAIVNGNVSGLLTLDPETLEKAKQCSYRPLLMLLGVMDHLRYDPVIHSYESPFGVGYLVVHFELG